MRALLTTPAVLALVAVASAAGADPGGTTVVVSGSSVTTTVNLDVCCAWDASDWTVYEPLVTSEVATAQNMWNAALAKLPGKGCFDIKVVFNARLLKGGEPWDPGFHRITIDLQRPGRSFSNDPGMRSANDDTDTVFKQVVDGQFYESSMDNGVWAHEIGHLMGLGDDYYHEHGLGHQEGDCLPGRGNSLMCHSRDGIIDQNIADRLADILNAFQGLPQCWTGTAHSDTTGTYGAGAVCRGEGWDHQVQFVVGSDNRVTGEARSRRVAMPSCSGPGNWPSYILSHEATAARFQISGELYGLDFKLRFGETFIDGGTGGLINYSLGLGNSGPVLTVPLMDFQTAKGAVETDVSVPMSTGGRAAGHHEFDLKCASCSSTPRPR